MPVKPMPEPSSKINLSSSNSLFDKAQSASIMPA